MVIPSLTLTIWSMADWTIHGILIVYLLSLSFLVTLQLLKRIDFCRAWR